MCVCVCICVYLCIRPLGAKKEVFKKERENERFSSLFSDYTPPPVRAHNPSFVRENSFPYFSDVFFFLKMCSSSTSRLTTNTQHTHHTDAHRDADAYRCVCVCLYVCTLAKQRSLPYKSVSSFRNSRSFRLFAQYVYIYTYD